MRKFLDRFLVRRSAPAVEVQSMTPTSPGNAISIPKELVGNHGKDADEARQIGAKFAETFEIFGGLRANDSILDIGCGPGRMAIGIGDRFGWKNEYIGFDILEKDINFCSRTISSAHPSFRFERINIYNSHYNPSGTVDSKDVRFPADDSSLDFVFATSIFTHLFTDETEHYLREAARVLRPGGRLFSTWFLLDETSLPLVEAGKARFSFAHRQDDGTRIQSPQRPADAVAHETQAIQAMLGGTGLSCQLYRGGWTRGPDAAKARHGQDFVVSELVA